MKLRDFNKFTEYAQSNRKSISHVLVRCDLNLPSDSEDLSRIYAFKDTVIALLSLGLKVILISHYKRPKKDERFSKKFSLSNMVDKISMVINSTVNFIDKSFEKISRADINSNLTLLDNLRFYDGEEKNDEHFARKIAELGDVFVNEAFSVSHRAHASVDAITKFIPSFAGISFGREVEALSRVMNNIDRPYTAIIGGAKVSSKIDVLREISKHADNLIITGAMANTFLSASGKNLGVSFVENDYFDFALGTMNSSKAKITLPVDFMASADINSDGKPFDIEHIPESYSCFDIGPSSILDIKELVNKTKTLLWNGAIGAFEFSNFDISSNEISRHIAKRTKSGDLVSIIGGGETVASIGNFKDDMTFVSNAGGAFLEYISGYTLPGVVALAD